MTTLDDFVANVSGFFRKSQVEQVVFLAWFAEVKQQRTGFDGAYLRQSFRAIGIEPPDMSVYLPRLAAKKPPQLIKEKGLYRLAGPVRRDLDKKLGGDPTTIAISQALADLPGKIPALDERTFLSEALSCYKVKAYRASIIMAWNLAYDHFVRWILADSARLLKLNNAINIEYPKKGLLLVRFEDLEALKESELIEASRVARLLDKNTFQIMLEKLGRRNMAAHPSSISINQHQADDMISDLVFNVILKFN